MAIPSGNPRLLGELFNEKELAAIYKVSVATVRRWRLTGGGPEYIKIGASVRYTAESVRAWLDSRPTGGGEVRERRKVS